MKDFGNFLLLILLIVSGVWFYRRYKANERKKAELEAENRRQRELLRQSQIDFFMQKIERIKKAIDCFNTYLETSTGYFSNYQLATWKSQNNWLFTEIRDRSFEHIQLPSEDAQTIRTFKDFFINADGLRRDFNKLFVKEELNTYSSFFDKVENRKLDLQQRTAVVTDEDNNIVIAGAGSGKTTTIVGKVNYVIDKYKVSAQEILLISFTKKSAEDLVERVNVKGLEAMTFHKFGKEVIVAVDHK